ncbi:MAG: c-type cytochrome [Elusimicrobia bacterium]|nr:c-type cytochrome [Elusimicrobiota bacterium]
MTLRARLLLLSVALLVTVSSRESSAAGPYDSIASTLEKAFGQLKRRRVAVLAFPSIDGRSNPGSKAVQERLTTVLASRKNVQIVEREAMDALLDEIALGYKGVLDPSSSYRLGRILDVDAVVTGTLTPLRDRKVEINARLISIPEGLVLAAAESWTAADWPEPDNSGEKGEPRFEDLLGPLARTFHSEAPATDRKPISYRKTKPEIVARGRSIYERECTHCHGPQGRGITVMADVLSVSPGRLDLSQASLKRYHPRELTAMLKRGTGKMPKHQKYLTEADITALLSYLHTLTSQP